MTRIFHLPGAAFLSEYELKANLQLAHVDAGLGAGNPTEAAGTRNGHTVCGKLVGIHPIARVTKVGMVEDIESVEPQLQISPFGEFEILIDRGIHTEQWGTDHHVPSQVSKRISRLQSKGLHIKPFVWSVSAELPWLAGRHIRPVLAHTGVGLILAGVNVDSGTGGHRPDHSEIPPAGEGAGQPVIHERAAFSEWQLVKRRSHKAVSLVEARQGALALKAILILRIDVIGADDTLPAAVIDRLRERIAKQIGKAVGHAPREFSGDRVVVGAHKANDLLDKIELRPW